MPATLNIGFIGAGKMATALARGFISAGFTTPKQVLASDPVESSRADFVATTGGNITAFNPDVLRECEVIFLSVKPAHISAALKEIAPEVNEKHLLISIAAGVTIASLESNLPSGARVIRVMPNTPALVGASASALAPGRSVLPGDLPLALKLFSSVGTACQVSESLLDAVTGLSGSGPAYVYLFIEALSDGGVAAGLPRELATKLAAQTVLGAARMVLETGLHPGVLKDMVTSPGGTTIQGLHELERGSFRGTVMSSVLAASERSRQLGQRVISGS